jgi:hypothetical protein
LGSLSALNERDKTLKSELYVTFKEIFEGSGIP